MNPAPVAGRELRAQPEPANTLLVALAGYGGAAKRERTRAAGFDEHFTKLLSFDVLQERLRKEPLR